MSNIRSQLWREIKGECPICGHKGGWCTVAADGSVVKCRRATSPYPVKQRDGSMAYLHKAGEVAGFKKIASKPKQGKYLTRKEIESFLADARAALTPPRLARLSKALGVSEKSLLAYGVGYAAKYAHGGIGCYCAPMYDGSRIPVGIHLRLETDGSVKFAVRGSQGGLFIPNDYSGEKITEGVCDDDAPLLLVTPEGLSDCCAARDLGFRAVGRQNNSGGGPQLCELLRHGHQQEIIVIGERDGPKWLKTGEPIWPGIEGPLTILQQIVEMKHYHSARFALPPEGIKDLRAWLNSSPNGGLATIVTDVMHNAAKVTPAWLKRAMGRIAQLKREQWRKAEAA